MSFRAETFLMQERWGDAVEAYERLDRDYGNDGNRAGIWLTLADTYGNRLGNERLANDYYRRVLDEYPDDIASATASLELASRDIKTGRYASARAMLEDVIERFPHEEAVRATAMQYLAMSYERSGMWEDAVAQFNALAREHPTTMYGLMALQHVAEGFEELGETEAAASALERAADHYKRVMRDYSSSPAELAARGYLIDTRIRQERWDEAARLLVETAERFPDSESSASMMIQAADIRADELSDSEGAKSVLRRAIGMFPDSEASSEAQRRLNQLGE
jgi:TolA-binding protein